MTSYNLQQWTAEESEEFLFAEEIKFRDHEPNSIVMHGSGNDEMLRVAQDGFYVRGVKVPVDDKEAETVYNAFKQWLAWASLQRS